MKKTIVFLLLAVTSLARAQIVGAPLPITISCPLGVCVIGFTSEVSITQTTAATAFAITNSTAATSSTAQSSPFDIHSGQFWYNPESSTGSPPVAAASTTDCWSHQIIETGGNNGVSIYNVPHNGVAGCIGSPSPSYFQTIFTESWGLQTNTITAASAPTVALQGSGSGATYTYAIVACVGVPCANVSTTTGGTGPTTINTSNWMKVTWATVTGADYYEVYRTAVASGSPSSTGAICFIPAGATLECDDKGLTADGTIAQAYNATGQAYVGAGPKVGGGTGGGLFGAEGSVPSTLPSSADGIYFNSTNHCADVVNNAVDAGCIDAVAAVQTVSGAKTFSGGVILTTTPLRDETQQVLVINMTAVATAGVNIGSTGSGNATFSFPITTANWFDLECKLPVTFVSSATIRFQLVSLTGSSTISFVNAETMGNTGASAVFQDLYTNAGTSLAGSETPATGAPGSVSEQITYSAQFLSSHAGTIGIEFVANGTNNVQMLKGGKCGITQIN